MRKLQVIGLCLLFVLATGCTKGPEFISIGSKDALLNEKPVLIKEVPYRLYQFRTASNEVIPPTTDLVDLKLAIQSGQARGQEVMLQVVKCWAPDLRKGVPSVRCTAAGGGDVYLAGDNDIRSKLLHLGEGQVGAIVGRALSLVAGIPLIVVL